MTKSKILLVAMALGAMLGGCSTEQTYNSMKGWQRNECNHRVDNREREQCLRDADQSYDDYQKERPQ